MIEEWRDVVEYEGIYEVSNLGRVRRVKSGCGTRIGRIAKGSASRGYMQVNLSKNMIQRRHSIHRLVATAFLGQCPDGKEVNHKDGIKKHNAVLNLEYVTRSENIVHAFRNGLNVAAHGERQWKSKLTEDNVREVRRLLRKESQRSIARLFNVDQSTICSIATGGSWGWLKEAE